MKRLLNGGLVLLLASVGGCGQQLVEFLDQSASAQDMATSVDLAGGQHDLAVPGFDLAGLDLTIPTDLSNNGDGPPNSPPPEIISTVPKAGTSNLCIPSQISVTFNHNMDPLTMVPANFSLTGPGATVDNITVSYDDKLKTATLSPTSPLQSNTTYMAIVSTGVRDTAGVNLPTNGEWSFTTNATPCVMLVPLGTLVDFVAVAGAGLTNTNSGGVTTLNGDVGLSPTATCLGDGIKCSKIDPTINGTLYANDPAGKAAQAKADLVTAYNNAMARNPGPVEADLSGKKLLPGVYTSASTMMISTNGVLTLDGNGDPNSVWIFQVGSALTVNVGAQVKLVNGARAANVFWAVGSSSTLLANVRFNGTILAQSSNSVGLNSVVNGRLLCTTGQITLISDTINLP